MALEILHAIRSATGPAQTTGLSDATIRTFLDEDPTLGAAIAAAADAFEHLRAECPDIPVMAEVDAIAHLQQAYVNFYSRDALNPYVALAARGPWIVTLHGAVVHDSGGYGMLGFGHGAPEIEAALSKPQVMANIMTPNAVQLRFARALRAEVGHARDEGCPFERFICMNSGSEAMTVAARIIDIRTKRLTGPGGAREGQQPVILAMERAFHGRTWRPATWSDSTRATYSKHLASFQGLQNLWTIPANDLLSLRAAFERAAEQGFYIQAVLMEPVQGEGSPGQAMSRAFYDLARKLTQEHEAFLVVDSIQAGLRAWGTLSIVDYPGFEDAECPDMESWSKALNGGQYPLSVLGVAKSAAEEYSVGVYGNTMTTNPRALEVAIAVLGLVDDGLRHNVREQGCAFVGDLLELQETFPELITEVTGTGLLFCCELNPERLRAIGPGSAEERMRMRGVSIIHGGRNALRFTPHFRISSAERELMMTNLREVLGEIRAELS